jgi:hypothetical protein
MAAVAGLSEAGGGLRLALGFLVPLGGWSLGPGLAAVGVGVLSGVAVAVEARRTSQDQFSWG